MSTRLTPGDPAPDFTLPSTQGEMTLSALRGHSVIVYFYPQASTPGCTTEACDFRDNLAGLQAAGYRVLGISPDGIPALERFATDEALTYPLLSDPDRTVMTQWGAYGEKNLYGRIVTGVIRSTIVVGPDGLVTLAKYNVRATGHVRALRRALGLDG